MVGDCWPKSTWCEEDQRYVFDMNDRFQRRFDSLKKRIKIICSASEEDLQLWIHAIKSRGGIVGMSGSKFSDVSTFKQTEVSFSLGNKCDYVMDQSDVVIRDDNICSVVKSIRIGQALQENIRNFL